MIERVIFQYFSWKSEPKGPSFENPAVTMSPFVATSRHWFFSIFFVNISEFNKGNQKENSRSDIDTKMITTSENFWITWHYLQSPTNDLSYSNPPLWNRDISPGPQQQHCVFFPPYCAVFELRYFISFWPFFKTNWWYFRSWLIICIERRVRGWIGSLVFDSESRHLDIDWADSDRLSFIFFFQFVDH